MNRVFVAYDTPKIDDCLKLNQQLGNFAQPKIGLEFFTANGPEGYRAITQATGPAFLDLKLHDIPNTVARAVTSLLPLKPTFLTVHASGGAGMLQAAREAAYAAGEERPKLLAVTVLTSFNLSDLLMIGQGTDLPSQVARLAKLAKESGMDGVVCGPTDISAVRNACGKDFLLVVPGIRPAWAEANDQKRVMTPKDAINAGADYLVIGRPITNANDPAAAAQKILDEVA